MRILTVLTMNRSSSLHSLPLSWGFVISSRFVRLVDALIVSSLAVIVVFSSSSVSHCDAAFSNFVRLTRSSSSKLVSMPSQTMPRHTGIRRPPVPTGTPIRRRRFILLSAEKDRHITTFESSSSSSTNTNSNTTTSTNSSSYNDLQRYQNRAALAEGILKEKVRELRLVQGKLQLLEQVVLKLKEDPSNTTTTTNQQDSPDSHDAERIVALETMLNETTLQLQQEKQQHQRLKETVQSVEREHERQRMVQTRSESKSRQLETSLTATRQEVLRLDGALEESQSEVMHLQKRLAHEQEELRNVATREQKRRERLEAELAAAKKKLVEKDRQLANNNNNNTQSQQQQQQQQQQQKDEEQRTSEAVEIATAAVRAAEKRERSLQKQYDDTLVELQSLQGDHERLMAKVDRLRSEREILEERENSDSPKFDQEIERLQTQMTAERHQFEGQLKLLTSISARRAKQEKEQRLQEQEVEEKDVDHAENHGGNIKGERGLWSFLRSRVLRRRRRRK